MLSAAIELLVSVVSIRTVDDMRGGGVSCRTFFPLCMKSSQAEDNKTFTKRGSCYKKIK